VNRYVIIVAGGTGARMSSSIPKQFMLLGQKPLLMYSIDAFFKAGINKIIVVIPLPFVDYWNELCQQYSCDIPHKVVTGGLFRTQSVKNGLEAIDDLDALVAIHDGVRPFVSLKTIIQAFNMAQETGTAVPYLDLTDSLRLINGKESKHVERGLYKAIQTPQCFNLSLLRRVYGSAQVPSFTDDAALVEQLSIPVTLFKGNEENIKITTPLDLIIAEAILKTRVQPDKNL